MAGYNRIVLMGNLTRDPQLSYLPSKTAVVDFGLATSRKYRRSDGTDAEDVCFVDCRCFGRMAETINKYCQKGRPLLVEGRLTFDTWEGQDGQKRSKHRVTVENFTFVGGGAGSGSRSGGGGGGSEGPDASEGDVGGGGAPDDDIPF